MTLFYERKENQNEITIVFKTMAVYITLLFSVLIALVFIFIGDETWKRLFTPVFFWTFFILIIGRMRPEKEIKKAMGEGYVEVKGIWYSLKNPVTYRFKKSMEQEKSNVGRVILATVIVASIVGSGVYLRQSSKQVDSIRYCLTATEAIVTYSSSKYSFKYPNNDPKEYLLTETGKENTYILTLSKRNTAKLEIFKASEYPGDRSTVGFSGEETPAEANAYMKDVKARSPKEYLKVGSYDVWLYYSENDSQAKNELKAIFDSIVVK